MSSKRAMNNQKRVQAEEKRVRLLLCSGSGSTMISSAIDFRSLHERHVSRETKNVSDKVKGRREHSNTTTTMTPCRITWTKSPWRKKDGN